VAATIPVPVRRLAALLAALAALSAAATPANALVPDDPALLTLAAAGGTPSLPDQWWAPRSGFPGAWDLMGREPAVVAVIDTGVDASHPEIAPQLLAAVDHDGDPRHGPATVDENGHGTHVASIACAAPDNGVGIAGAGLGCRLIVEKTDLTDASIAASIRDAVARGADAINMSFGTDDARRPSREVVEAIDHAYERGVVLVAAAADRPRRQQGAPANLLQPTGTGPDITAGKGLTVTAATSENRRAPFAGRGSQISLAAYGAVDGDRGSPGLLGAFPANSTVLERGGTREDPIGCGCRTSYHGDPRYAYLAGTSMAAPQVAATAALMRRANPDLRVADILRLIKRTATRPPRTGWTPELGWGVLDAGHAMRAAREVDRTAPTSRLVLAASVGGGSVALRWRGHDTGPPGVRRSGVARYEVWRAAGHGPAQRMRTTASTSALVPVLPGVRNRFFTVAIDAAGNREARPGRRDRSRVRGI
jgi:subtilisin family serine protease